MSAAARISGWLLHPATRGMDVDDPQTTERRRAIIRNKRFLFQLYEEWYGLIRRHLPSGADPVVELGSGAGFMKEWIPGLVTTDVLPVAGVDRVLPATGILPFADGSLRAIVMTDVLHHIGTPERFFTEAARVVRPGGAIVMIEPWVTPWSRFVYGHFHSEPFRPEAEQWGFPDQGPLSGANGALPWILFVRDRSKFERQFPEWSPTRIEPLMPFAYLLSGGVSLRSLAPGWAYRPCRVLERALGPVGKRSAMFALITLVRNVPRPETIAGKASARG